tara:strand:- start:1182 stop:1874 length:693 start_codon:yes stop_codon:yes gene_type:complete
MTINAIAIDDEPNALEVIKVLSGKVPFINLMACFTNAFDAIPFLQQNKVDVLFLDIKMPDISGIEFIQCLPRKPEIIFTTAYSDYAVQGFELDAVDYLLKPFSLSRFTKACNKVLELQVLRQETTVDFIFVKTGFEEVKIALDDINYIEAEGNYVAIVLKNKKILCRQTMQEISQLLPEKLFTRIHRSYIVAIGKIEKITRQDIFVLGKEIPIGVSYEATVEMIREKLRN